MILVAVADHRKVASEQSAEVAPAELAEIGIEAQGVPAAVTVENFAEEPEKPEEQPAAAVVAEEGHAFLAYGFAAEQEADSGLAPAAVDVDVEQERPVPVPVDATADARVALASGAADADVAGANPPPAAPEVPGRIADSEAAAVAHAEEAGASATAVQAVEALAIDAEGASLVVQAETPRVAQPAEERGMLRWSQQWPPEQPVEHSHA